MPPLVTTNFLVKDQGEKGINFSLWRLLLQDYQLTDGLLSVFNQRPDPHWSLEGGKPSSALAFVGVIGWISNGELVDWRDSVI